ncbi:MAG: desulfoferrodoxin [Bacilli bacterium]|nr:desulfoferrodoxin [Bacilli bacterium]
MNDELIIKKCLKCGAIVKVLQDCKCNDCDIMCCNEEMQTLKTNSTDAAVEKHVPTYEIENDTLKVRVNHVMDEEHYIEWICLKTERIEEYVHFKPGEEAVAVFKNVSSGTLYAYCNKHGLWNTTINK